MNFTDPVSGDFLCEEEGSLKRRKDLKVVAPIVNGIPRFVKYDSDYAKNFGYQWNKWDSLLSDERNLSDFKYNEILKRTNFDKLDTRGKSILECGCGGGDDTEVLLKLPFSKVYAFDLSNAIDRAQRYLGKNERLRLFQASIFDIPVDDLSFDFVYCHRVLQHTPDPTRALISIMKKVKEGGYLFVHSYHASEKYLKNYKYKYRFITKRIPYKWVEFYVEKFGPMMHRLKKVLHNKRYLNNISYRLVPFEYYESFADFNEKELIELEKLVTFDALTPSYDLPMTWNELKSIVEENGFKILFSHPNPNGSPIYLTAQRVKRV